MPTKRRNILIGTLPVLALILAVVLWPPKERFCWPAWRVQEDAIVLFASGWVVYQSFERPSVVCMERPLIRLPR